MTRVAWVLGNWLGALVFAFRIGYRDGQMLRKGTRPTFSATADQSTAAKGDT